MARAPRLTAPSASDKNWINQAFGGNNRALVINRYTGSVLANCTGYGHGRWLELLGKQHNLCLNNAVAYWSFNDGYARGQTPKLYAMAVWSGGSQGYGHVAVVEKIYSDGSILVSNSNYSGTVFYTKRIYKPYVPWTGYKLLGFIYLPEDGVGTPVARDVAKNQVKVIIDGLNGRAGYEADAQVLGMVNQGYYNVLAEATSGGYVRYQIEDNLWIASNESKWTTYYPKKIESVGAPVERDVTRDQIQVLIGNLNARDNASVNADRLGYINAGIYNIISTQPAGSYTFYQVEPNVWFAANEGEWTAFFAKEEKPKMYTLTVGPMSEGDKVRFVSLADEFSVHCGVTEVG